MTFTKQELEDIKWSLNNDVMNRTQCVKRTTGQCKEQHIDFLVRYESLLDKVTKQLTNQENDNNG